MQSETSQTDVKLSFDHPAPLVESLPTVSQRPEAQALATSETPELNVSVYLNTPSGLGGKRVPCHHVKTLALAASELQHRFNKHGVERRSGDSSLSTNFFNREEVPGKKDIHTHVKELDPDMYLAKPGRFARQPLGWQGTASSMAPNESLTILEAPLIIFQSGWLVPFATELRKATLTTEPVLFAVIIENNGSPCFCSANLWQLVPKKFWCLLAADKNECKDAKERDAVVPDEIKRSTDVATDEKSAHAVWKKPEDKRGRIHLTRDLETVRARRLRRTQPRQASHGLKMQATHILDALEGDKIL